MRANTGWLTPTAAGRRLGVHATEVYRLIDSGDVPAYRYDNDRLIRIREADAAEP